MVISLQISSQITLKMDTWNVSEQQKSVYIEETKENEYGKLLIKHGSDLQKIYYREKQQKYILFESKFEHDVEPKS